MNIWTFSPVIVLGPSRDAGTGDVIWRHRALDADGICSPGNWKKNKFFKARVSLSSLRSSPASAAWSDQENYYSSLDGMLVHHSILSVFPAIHRYPSIILVGKQHCES